MTDKSLIFNALSDYATKHLVQPILPNRTSFDEEYMLHYVKRVVGTDADREYLKLSRKPKFINEREWRFVPSDAPMYFTRKGKGGTLDCLRLSKLTESQKLELTPKDIEYIFIKEESEREAIIKEIRRIYQGSELGTVDVLISRVTSSEQMKNDF